MPTNDEDLYIFLGRMENHFQILLLLKISIKLWNNIFTTIQSIWKKKKTKKRREKEPDEKDEESERERGEIKVED